MDAMKHYFRYGMTTSCGIPEITLQGDPEDWKLMREKVSNFSQLGMGQWVENIQMVLDNFVSASLGNEDRTFWESFYKRRGGSGGPFVTGWINLLFPYLAKGKNRVAWSSGNWMSGFSCPKPQDFDPGMSKAPFVWNYYMQEFDMEFLAGFVGVQQNDDLLLTPEIGWVIRDQ